MRSFIFLSILTLLIVGTLSVSAFAQEECSSCEEAYSLEQTIAAAELIILAESEPFTSAQPGGPATIEAKVLSVLKGAYLDKTITLKSWLGSCPYGFVFTRPKEILFIVKDITGAYTSYKDGCGIQSLPYDNQKIDGKFTLEEFKATYIK
jgi:hypothetical protein